MTAFPGHSLGLRSKFLVLPALIAMQVFSIMRKYWNHNFAIRACWNFSFYKLILSILSLTSVSVAASSNYMLFSSSRLKMCEISFSCDSGSMLLWFWKFFYSVEYIAIFHLLTVLLIAIELINTNTELNWY